MNIAELQQRFLAGLDRRLGELTAALEAMGDAESLMRKFHSLAGIAGTYGYHRVTDVSRECELACVTAMEEIRALTDDERGRLRAAIETIRVMAGTAQSLK